MKLNPIGSNQTVIESDGGNTQIFFSYKTPVAAFVLGKLYKTEKHWSQTTSKHINRWIDGRNVTTKPQEFFDTLIK